MARPIAILAAEFTFPGGTRDLRSLHRSLLDATPHVGALPPGPRHGSWSDPPHAGWVDGIERFDPAAFGLSIAEARLLDPRHRLLLLTSRAALHASSALDDAEACGVYLGLGTSEYRELCPPGDPRTATGTESSTAAGRIAHTFGLGGPALVVDTACSSALVALHLAVGALRSGQCSVALVGAAQLIGSPAGWERLARTGILSPDGRCRPMDQGANGTVRGEGGGVLVLRTLEHAEALDLPILGVISGCAIGHDGAAAGLTVPNGPAQQRVVRAALADAEVAPEDIAMIEAHATGTSLGDPIEVEALHAVFGDRPVPITATKAVFGHLEAAAGLLGLLAALSHLRQGTAAPIANLTTLSERLPPEGPVPAQTAQQLTDDAPYAGVSAFGLSGTNAHVVLRAGSGRPPEPPSFSDDPQPLWVSAAPAAAGHTPSTPMDPTDMRAAVATVLGGDPDRIPAERSLFEIGLDSVGAAELARRLDVPVATIFEHPTLASLQARHGGRPSRHAARNVRSTSPVAIVAAACRFPGGVTDLDSYFELLCSDRDPVGPAPPGRDIEGPGGFLDDVFGFDPEAFGLSAREAEVMDPQQRLWLEVAAEAVDRGGLRAADLADTGLFVGAAESQYLRDWREPDVGVGNEGSFVAGRSAHVLGLGGPVLTLNTACSASLVAVHTAARALADGECSAAIAGGVSLLLSSAAQQMLGALGVLSPTGRCHTYSRKADGYVRGEGAAAVLMMRLDEAMARGHEVLAVIRGSAVAHDGRTGGVAVPGPGAWRTVVSRALAHAGLQGNDIGYVEVHGSATPLGDAIEVRTLGEALTEAGRSGPVWAGCAKTRLGHLEQAAGMAGLLKVLAMLEHGVRTPNLHFEGPNADLPEGVVRVPTEVQPWDGPRVAGVSAFGISGTAAHVIVSAPPVQVAHADGDTPVWLPVSARTPEAVAGLADALATALRGGLAPQDAARTLAARAPHPVRATVVARPDELADALRDLPTVPAGTPEVAWIFTGAGPQRPAMGADLPGLDSWIGDHEHAVRTVLGPGLLEVLTTPDDRIGDIAWTVTATVALQLFLVDQLRGWGLAPVAVAGHSFGEISAACAAGVLTTDDTLRLAALRGARMREVPTGGTLLVVRTSEATARAAATEHVDVAAANGPEETVLSGPRDALTAVEEALGVDTHWLDVDRAWHSRAVQPAVEGFVADLADLPMTDPVLPLFTCLDGQRAEGRATYPAHWGALLRNTVQFRRAVEGLQQAGCTAYVEVGPHPALLASVAATTRCAPEQLLPTLHREQPPAEALLHTVAGLWTLGAPVDPRDHVGRGRIRSDVPVAPLQRTQLRATTPAAAVPSAPYYDFVWEPLLGGPSLAPPTPGRWGVVGDSDLANDIAALLAMTGAAVVRSAGPDLDGVVLAPPVDPDAPHGAVLAVVDTLRGVPTAAHVVVASQGTPGVLQGAARALAWERPRVTALTFEGGCTPTILGWDHPELWWRAQGPHAPRAVPCQAPEAPETVRGTWIVLGGFGVLGRGLAMRLVERGAQRVIVAGPRTREVPAPLEAHTLDAADAEGLRQLITRNAPVQGIVLAAGVLRDARVEDLTDEDVRRVLDPKLRGIAAMQSVAEEVPQWLLMASASGWVGSPGQTAYAAANAALDAAAIDRHARGRHACSVALGPVAGAGMAAAQGQQLADQHAALGIRALPMSAALDALERGLSPRAPATLGAFDVDWSRLPQRAPPAAGGTDAPTPEAVEAVILRVANRHLRKRVPDLNTDLTELGLDSMTALTLRNALVQEGIELPIALVMTGPSISELVFQATRETRTRHAEPAPPPRAAPAPPSAVALALSVLVLVAAVGLLMAQA